MQLQNISQLHRITDTLRSMAPLSSKLHLWFGFESQWLLSDVCVTVLCMYVTMMVTHYIKTQVHYGSGVQVMIILYQFVKHISEKNKCSTKIATVSRSHEEICSLCTRIPTFSFPQERFELSYEAVRFLFYYMAR